MDPYSTYNVTLRVVPGDVFMIQKLLSVTDTTHQVSYEMEDVVLQEKTKKATSTESNKDEMIPVYKIWQ